MVMAVVVLLLVLTVLETVVVAVNMEISVLFKVALVELQPVEILISQVVMVEMA